MKPQPQNYTVHEVEGGYQVHTTYDLFHIGKPWPIGQLYKTSFDAFCNANNMYIRDMRECERAKEQGRSWPEND